MRASRAFEASAKDRIPFNKIFQVCSTGRRAVWHDREREVEPIDQLTFRKRDAVSTDELAHYAMLALRWEGLWTGRHE
jgi:hypothetical protein